MVLTEHEAQGGLTGQGSCGPSCQGLHAGYAHCVTVDKPLSLSGPYVKDRTLVKCLRQVSQLNAP